MIWNKEMETMSIDQMKCLQLERLKEQVEYVTARVPFYKERINTAINSLEDLQKLPFTVKEDLRDNYPYGLFAQPLDKIARIHGSSGTTGKPTVVGYTKEDLAIWAECVARLISAAGGTNKDITQIAFGYGLFTGAFGLHQGMELIGATVIPMSSGNTEKQILMLKDMGATILVSTPSYALYIGEVARDMGVTPDQLKLKLGLFGAEGHTAEMRAKLEESLGITVTENYGLSEIMGPGVSGECLCREGMHIAADHFIPEIIDPKTLEVLPVGQIGELVITTITKKGFPLIRYRTKDITYLTEQPCKCGRTSVRMAKVQGRSDDMLIIKGVNVFPSQVESALIGMEHIGPHYQLILRREGYMDTLEVQVELLDNSLLDSFAQLTGLEKKIKAKLMSVLGLDAKVRLVEPKTIERSMGKAKRVIDLRK